MITRRTLLKFIGASTAYSLTSCTSLGKSSQKYLASDVQENLKRQGPIDRTDLPANRFTGDDFNHLAHEFLQNKEAFVKAGATSHEKAPLVIVGGGMSGLFSAYLLRQYNPILLERAPRFGGNSKGESWQGIDYSLGAAYFTEHEKDSELYQLFSELGIYDLCRVKKDDDPILFQKKRFDQFWSGETDPQNKKQFELLAKHFKDMFNEENGIVFPDLPLYEEKKRSYVQSMDRKSLQQYLEEVAGGKLHPHITAAIEHYCWSTSGASMAEISAAAGLSQYACEFGEVNVPPGGNSGIAEQVYRRLMDQVDSSRLRANSLVMDVKVDGDGAKVLYLTPDKKLHTIECQAVVMACPKFVVGKILSGIEPKRAQAIKKLRYNAYLVGNALLEQVPEKEFYDLYMIGDGKVNLADVRQAADEDGITDVVLATYARKHASKSVLTLYRALPFTGGRAELMSPMAYEKYKNEFATQIEKEILPSLNIPQSSLVDLRLTRWAHPMPVADRGLFADGTLEQIQKPFRRRVFFIEQDNWMQPAIETCAEEALKWTKEVKKVL
jgi:protoporphyrinogen oxidase